MSGESAEFVPDLVALRVGLLVEFDDLHDRLGIPLLLLVGNTRLLEELLPLIGHTGELAGGRVEADMHGVDCVIWRDFRTIGECKEVSSWMRDEGCGGGAGQARRPAHGDAWR